MTPQSALLGFFEPDDEQYHLTKHILLLFKLYVYNSRIKRVLQITELMNTITGIANLELKTIEISQGNQNYVNKWNPISALL